MESGETGGMIEPEPKAVEGEVVGPLVSFVDIIKPGKLESMKNVTPPAPITAVKNESTETNDFARHVEKLVRMEKFFPKLVRAAARIITILENHGKHKGYDPRFTKFDEIRWYGDGWIVFNLLPNGDTLPRFKASTKFHTFNALKQMDERYPQVVSLVMSLAEQLTGSINRRRVMPGDIDWELAYFVGPDQDRQPVGKIRLRGRIGDTMITPAWIGVVQI